MRSRIRFAVALAAAAVLGGWLLVASFGGALETYSGPGEVVVGETYRLNGIVAEGAPVDAGRLAQSAEGLRFAVLDKEDNSSLEVLYRGDVPDAFAADREIVVTGTLDESGVFIARRNSLITLCPSKFKERAGDSEAHPLEIPELSPE